MKIGNGVGLLLASSVLLLAGCAGFWDAPPSTSTTTTTPTTLSSGVFYVLNQTTKQIAAYSISSGTLVPVSGSPYTLAATPFCIAVAPNSTQSGGFLYVGTDAGIYLYDIESGGGLTPGNGGDVISSDIPAAMQVYGSWLVDAFVPSSTAASVQLDAIPINATTGLYAGSGGASPSQTFINLTNVAVKQLVISPDGDNVFVALSGAGTLVDPFVATNSNPLGATAKTIVPCEQQPRCIVCGRGSHRAAVLYRRDQRRFGRNVRRLAGLTTTARSPIPRLRKFPALPLPAAGLLPTPSCPSLRANTSTSRTAKEIPDRATLHGFPLRPQGPPIRWPREAVLPEASSPLASRRIATIILCWPCPRAAPPQAAIPTWKPSR